MSTTPIRLEKKTLEYRINAEFAENEKSVNELVKSKLLQQKGYVLLKWAVMNPYNEKMATLYITLEKIC